ncbi:MAG TPA: polysaccharide biosynthesis tyrosine autokinase [Actinomycetota bacterium]|nr:polysaccharide biosynthesis tyrosine autokinase [Actinomycetota bacterium]
MNPRDYVRAVRRRWADVALAVAVSVAAGWAITEVAPPGPPPKTYRATAVLVNPVGAPTVYTNLETLAALTTVGRVPERVARELRYQGDPSELAALIRPSVDREAGVLRITATDDQAARAVRLANAFARELLGFLGDERARDLAEQGRSLTERLEALEAEIRDLDRRIAAAASGEVTLLQAQRDAKVRQYGLLYESYQQLAASLTQRVGLQLIEATAARPVSTGGIQAPRSREARVVIAGLLGLVAGVVLVLFLDRFDTKIRTRRDAEERLGVPVLAEIPHRGRMKRRSDEVIAAREPRSPAADAFAMLATLLPLRMGAGPAASPDGDGAGNGEVVAPAEAAGIDAGERPPAKVVLVTSPGPGEGKTTVVANLAATYGMRGQRCLVLSCDLRHPKVHRLFGVPNAPGFAEDLRNADGRPVLRWNLYKAQVPGVLVVPSGPPPPDPGPLLSSPRMRRAIEEARGYADVVLIDTAPLLTTSDAAALLPLVDAVLLVVRAGRTTAEVAERTAQICARVGARVVGAVLNAATEIPVPRYYYTYYRRTSRKVRDGGIPHLARQGGARQDGGW